MLQLLFLLGIFSASASHAAPASSSITLSSYDRAERAREALEARPEAERTRRDYGRTLNLFRAIYHNDPASPRADASIYAVAGLLLDEGRIFHDEKTLHDAIAQYEFLRREYPASHYRYDALFAQADIYLHDLNDPPAAKAAYQFFLKQYPRNPLSKDARKALKDIHSSELAGRRPVSAATITTNASQHNQPAPLVRHSDTVLTAAVQSQQTETPPSIGTKSPSRGTIPPASTLLVPPPLPAQSEQPPPAIVQPATLSQAPAHKGKAVAVTGVRHWSTPIYTRVAIDLGDEVQYEAARVPGPDRIFFDLHGARLSNELVGKSIDVTDDGFLKRIRAAQFSNDVTRIVLDVSDVSDYSAFLLPNPYRLIIDIHGKKPGGPVTQQATTASPASTAIRTTADSVARPVAPGPMKDITSSSSTSTSPRSRQQVLRPRRQQPGLLPEILPPALLLRTLHRSPREVASLSHQADRVKATARPTTAPIAASVAGTTPAVQPDLTDTKAPAPIASKRHKSKDSDLAEMKSAGIHEADPTAEGSRSMVRALGLKIGRIVVDAGHGGHDSGTLGPEGIQEKDVVLDVALRLGKLLKQRLGADVIFTRSDDTFIPLETRTAIANKAQADLFVSVHANSSSDPSARGVETYYLNFTSSPESLELAARENAVSQQSIHQLSDLVKKIALHDKIDESREFAADVEKYLYEGLDQGNPGLKDRGVKQAPFVVLIGANMPSILAEISFLTNPEDARQLRDPNYRQRIAESLYRGVARYISGLSGVRLADNSRHSPSD